MKRREVIREILTKLISQPNLNNYSREDIEQAIRVTRWTVDQRTIDNWFTLLWKLNFFTQPKPGRYSLNLSNLVELDISLPCLVDPKQQRLKL
jgi:hypothetical protein